MASSAKNLTRQYSLLLFPTIIKVSWQRGKRSWPLLSVAWLAMIVMVALICVEPLFGSVTTFAQFQDAARTSVGGADLTTGAISEHPTVAQIQQLDAQMGQFVQAQMGSYVGTTSQFALKTPDLQIVSPNNSQTVDYHFAGRSGALSGGPGAGDLSGENVLAISAYDPAQIAGQIKILQGRLPAATSSQLEIAISAKSARDLGLHLGSVVQVRYPVSAGSIIWQLNVVGIIAFQPSAGDFWHSGITDPARTDPTEYDGQLSDGGATEYNALAAQQMVLPQAATISGGNDFPGFNLTWRYPLNLANLNADTLNTLLDHYQILENQLNSQSGQITGTNGVYLNQSNFISALYNLQRTLIFAQVIAVILLCLTLALALIMTGTMAQVVVERETATIATMRSRGATRSHIFWAFATQGAVLALTAACIGPLLAWLLVRFIAAHLLSSADQAALGALTGDLTHALLEVRWYALVAALATFVTLLLALKRATKIDIVKLRRETARATQRPFWRRFHLDILLALLTCAGYIIYLFVLSSPLANHVIVRSLAQFFSLITVPLILSAVLLLFLRALPWLLRKTTRVVARRGSAPALLAFAQMERAPRTASRLILLCTVALVSSLYLLTMVSTQQQWYRDQTNFQVGADFSGAIDSAHLQQSFAQQMHFYGTIPGVQSATLGYTEQNNNLGPHFSLPPLTLDAVDATTYADTANWSTDYSQQSLSTLMQQLAAHRADANTHDVVYAITDASLWRALGLYPGANFALPVSGYGTNQSMHFVAVAQITHIPGVYSSTTPGYSSIGLLVDYQSYAAVYTRDNPSKTATPNAVWLRTASDAASLASVRHAVPTLLDRRALLDAAQVDPAHVNILNIFISGIVVALVLALLGMLIVSWFSIASRRTNFAALRALGMAPRQIVSVLVWEQSLAYIIALLLGLGLSALCFFNVAPTFSFISSLAYNDQGAALTVLPVHVVFPLAQAALLIGFLIVSSGLALVFMAQRASRPTLGQALRLNED